jgi:hypothetical protein
MFWNKKKELSPTDAERIAILEASVTHLKVQIIDLNLSYNTLSDRIQKKLKSTYTRHEEEETKDNPTDPYKGMLLPESIK